MGESESLLKPQTIVGFEIISTFVKEDVTEVNDSYRKHTFAPDNCQASITFTRDTHTDVTLDAVIGIPLELHEKIRALLQEHLDTRAKR